MNPLEMVVLIVAIVVIGGVLRARHQHHADQTAPDPIETATMKSEIAALKDRIAVLERLATDDNQARLLDREIEKLR